VKRGIDEQGGQIPKLSNEHHTSSAAIDRSEQVDVQRGLGEPERKGLIDLVQQETSVVICLGNGMTNGVSDDAPDDGKVRLNDGSNDHFNNSTMLLEEDVSLAARRQPRIAGRRIGPRL
jgi:hypothetical protein